MSIELSSASLQVLVTFGLYLVGVAALGVFAHRYLTKGSFVKQYFLGNRGLGPWVLAMTLAATAISGGTFMGFPSLIYTNGWIMALWIASYMLNPLMCMVLMGKRLNQMARLGGSVTVPDVFRDRFASPTLGIAASILILIFLVFNLVAQFKGGGLIMKEAMQLPPLPVNLAGIWTVERGYLIGLIIFAATVVAYTTYGGFWAVTWTDVLEGVVMLLGVVLMAVLAVLAVEPYVSGGVELHGLSAATARLNDINPQLVYGPGPKNFLPLGLAFSFFIMWTMISAGQPSGMVRLMSFKDMPSLRRALLLVVFYYILTYFSLLIIFICARAIYPTQFLGQEGSEGIPDSIMPVMARYLTQKFGVTWLGGLLLAAPYAAIMSTVAAFLLLISSSLVRDLYQRVINPKVKDKTLKRLSYFVTSGIGLAVLVLALNPPDYLQYFIIFTGTGQGASFLFPMLLSLYWKRATKQGVLAGMLGGFAVVMVLYVLGWTDSGLKPEAQAYEKQVRQAGDNGDPIPEPSAAVTVYRGLTWIPGWGDERLGKAAPLYAGGVDPLIWALLASLLLCVGVSLATRPDPELVKKYFPD